MRRFADAIGDLTRAIDLKPSNAHYRAVRGKLYRDLNQLDPAIADLEAALALEPDHYLFRESLAEHSNARAWELANGPVPHRDLERAVALARRAVEMSPGHPNFRNTLGVVYYRARSRADEAIATLERSRVVHRGRFDGFDLIFLAMAHHKLGHRNQARESFDRAVRWLREQSTLNARDS